ncbi:CheR family methyltransferase [Saccharophagus degradans]|uniref:Chemotaxis protein methyltransferase n=1 Tax=Saccharophagus degradans (strain 2-40 / ATCC 43961 / DSM 17024) TaxID=203122 RepID=Q21G18_SACD2|nr:protein-glutamate O-methyltransferase [Saccharophagus degradans]ABD82361.1 MCP methyltransferase, CheR-type [Saccharophagus degradans 2-40]
MVNPSRTAVVGDHEAREFPMSIANFEIIKRIAMEWTGISLSDHKRNMIYGRLSRRLRALGLSDFNQYCNLLEASPAAEKTEFINSITTNLTAFFREIHHFEYLARTVIPNLMRANAASRKIRIWSAGCSTGEEPYSIAMVFKSFSALKGWDVKILATDLDSNVVAKGAGAVYPIDRAEGVPDKYRQFFKRDKTSNNVQIKDSVRELIRFRQLNLLHEWPMRGSFDIIFCRNVVIYFDLPTQKKLFNRYADMLVDNGHLFIGHSENLYKVTDRFNSMGRTIYQKAY